MIEIVISQTANGFLVRKTDYLKPSGGPYGETYIAKDADEAIKIVTNLLAEKKTK
jgi:L-lactate utilization protein LutB